jgi:hypothetical protein
MTSCKKALQETMSVGYGDTSWTKLIPGVRRNLTHPNFNTGDHKAFKLNAEKLLIKLEKESSKPSKAKLAEKTFLCLSDTVNALLPANKKNMTADEISTDIKRCASNLKKHAACYSLTKSGRTIAGILMTLAGIGLLIASSATAFLSFGAALPISAPLAVAGTSLSAAGILTIFGPFGMKRRLKKAAELGERIATTLNPRPN